MSKNLINLTNLVNICFGVRKSEKGFIRRNQICTTPKFPKCLAKCGINKFRMRRKSIAYNLKYYLFSMFDVNFREYVAKANQLRESHKYLSTFRLIWHKIYKISFREQHPDYKLLLQFIYFIKFKMK